MRPRLIIVAVVGLLALSGCGRSPAVNVTEGELFGYEQQIADVLTRVEGSADARRAGQRRVYTMFQGAVQRCMAKAGHQYDPPEFVEFVGNASPSLNSWWLRKPGGSLGVGESASMWVEKMQVRDPGGNAYLGLTKAEQDVFDKALDKCGGPSSGYENADFPDAYWVALGGLNKIANEVTAELDREFGKSYTECMAASGFEVADGDELYEQVGTAYDKYRTVAMNGKDSSSEWDVATVLETRAATADAECRADAYRAGMAMAAPQVASWADHHGELLDLLDTQWQDLVQRYG